LAGTLPVWRHRARPRSSEFFLRTRDAVFPGLTIAQLFEITDGPLHEEIVGNIINVNGADHGRLRSLVNPALAPRTVDRCRPAMRGFLKELLDAIEGEGRCELIETFAKPYPSLVMASVMGAPLSDAPKLYEWSNWIQRQFDANSLMAERERIELAATAWRPTSSTSPPTATACGRSHSAPESTIASGPTWLVPSRGRAWRRSPSG
jgi:cytochrome P450